MKNNRIKKSILYICFFISCISFGGCGSSYLTVSGENNEVENKINKREDVDNTGFSDNADISSAVGTENQNLIQKNDETALIIVQVSGAVENPGVFSFKEGARVYEAIEMAGGLSEDADDFYLNQALRLSDGERIYVYRKGERESLDMTQELDYISGGLSYGVYNTSDDESGSGLVNINTANISQLCTLSGIGESRAQSIIDYRTEHGRFNKIEDLMQVSGIKENLFNKIKSQIRI